MRRRLGCRRPGRGRLAGAVIAAERLADLDGGAVAGQDLDQHAVGERRQLDHGLVGLDLDDGLAAPEGLARLLQPAGDAAFLHGLAEARQGQGGGHRDTIRAMVSTTRPTVGMPAPSRSGETEIGMSSPAMRITRVFEIVEAFLGDAGGDLGRDAGRPGALAQRHGPAGAVHRGDDRVHVERVQRCAGR